MGKGNNLEGFINGKLTGIKFLYRNNNRNNVWLAKCECGNKNTHSEVLNFVIM